MLFNILNNITVVINEIAQFLSLLYQDITLTMELISIHLHFLVAITLICTDDFYNTWGNFGQSLCCLEGTGFHRSSSYFGKMYQNRLFQRYFFTVDINF